MFEGKPPQLGAKPDADESLRPLSWDDLVARLSAARDLRAHLGAAQADSAASFDAGSAQRIAHHNGKGPVNPEDSANGKVGGGTAGQCMRPELPSFPGAVRK